MMTDMRTMRSGVAAGADLIIPPSRSVDGFEVLRPVGVIDSSSVRILRQSLAELPSPCRAVLDLGAVPFIDSAGLGAIIGGLRHIRDLGGDLELAAPRSSISRVFVATGIDRITQVHPSVEQAVAAYRLSGVVAVGASLAGA